MKTVGIIGYGNMGGAFCRGLKGKGVSVAVAEKKGERTVALKKEMGLDPVPLRELIDRSAIILLAVKPQELDDLFGEIAGKAEGKQIVSIIAGKTLADLSRALKTESVCRFMPNLAALAGKAAVGVSFPDHAEERFRGDCLSLAEAVGESFVIPERLMSAFTGLSGSGIAYALSFLHALALGGAAAGIRYDEALKIALATVEGATAAVRSSGVHPVELLTRVVSPSGTTIQGIRRLEAAGFAGTVMQAVEDAAARARQLES